MAEEDPLQYLKDRIKEDANRRSRAAALPLDNAPETYMGASVKELAEEQSEGGAAVRPPLSVSPARRKSRVGEEEEAAEKPKPEGKQQEEEKEDKTTGGGKGPETAIASDEDGAPRKPRTKKLDRSRARQTSLVTKILSQDVSIPLDEGEERKDEADRRDENQAVKEMNVAAAAAATSSPEEELRKEVEQLEDQLEEATEQLEDYDVLCGRLLGAKKPSARNLAIYIGELRDAVEDAESYKEKLRSTSGELVLIKADMENMQRQTEGAKEEIRQLHSELEAAQARLANFEAAQDANTKVTDDEERLQTLEATLASRDEEVERLRKELAELKEMPSSLEEENALYRQAEEDLEAMETMLREQEEFMAKLEADMEKNLQALPPSLREAFLKEKERMLTSLGERVTDKEEEREKSLSTKEDSVVSLGESLPSKSGSPSPKTSPPLKKPPSSSPTGGEEEVRSSPAGAPVPAPKMKSFAEAAVNTAE